MIFNLHKIPDSAKKNYDSIIYGCRDMTLWTLEKMEISDTKYSRD